jgi:3-deoxy-D-manno-octulosonic-acid transferase
MLIAPMRRLYGLLVHLAVPIAFAVVVLRGLRDRGYWQGLPERFGFGAAPRTRPSLWLHAVSLGEVTAAAPLVRALLARYPHTPLVLTTATPTGRARAQALFGAAVDVRFLPYDTAASIDRFLGCIDPEIAVILETELWPNLFDGCARRAVPLLLASARISAKSAARYRRFAGLFAGMLGAVTVAAQTTADAERFIALGAEPRRTSVVGNVKFDIEVGPAVLERGQRLRSETLGSSRAVWVAGSTHAGEEEIALDAHRVVLGNRPGTLLVLAPRHPNRFDAVAALLERRGCRFVRRRGASPLPADVDVLLLDTVGELLEFYAAADVAFVGGSLVPIGGHNLLEPAAAGLPVLTGPSNFNAKEVASLLLSRGGARSVRDAADIARSVSEFLADADARRRVGAIARATVAENRGSVARLLELIEATRSLRQPHRPARRP